MHFANTLYNFTEESEITSNLVEFFPQIVLNSAGENQKYILNFTFVVEQFFFLKKLNFHVNVKEEPDIHTTNATFSIFLKQNTWKYRHY